MTRYDTLADRTPGADEDPDTGTFVIAFLMTVLAGFGATALGATLSFFLPPNNLRPFAIVMSLSCGILLYIGLGELVPTSIAYFSRDEGENFPTSWSYTFAVLSCIAGIVVSFALDWLMEYLWPDDSASKTSSKEQLEEAPGQDEPGQCCVAEVVAEDDETDPSVTPMQINSAHPALSNPTVSVPPRAKLPQRLEVPSLSLGGSSAPRVRSASGSRDSLVRPHHPPLRATPQMSLPISSDHSFAVNGPQSISALTDASERGGFSPASAKSRLQLADSLTITVALAGDPQGEPQCLYSSTSQRSHSRKRSRASTASSPRTCWIANSPRVAASHISALHYEGVPMHFDKPRPDQRPVLPAPAASSIFEKCASIPSRQSRGSDMPPSVMTLPSCASRCCDEHFTIVDIEAQDDFPEQPSSRSAGPVCAAQRADTTTEGRCGCACGMWRPCSGERQDKEYPPLRAAAAETAAASSTTEESPLTDSNALRVGVFTAIALAVHNFPEGLATFSAALADPTFGIGIALAIAAHNVPEGMAVAAPIYYATGSRCKAFCWGALSGMAEPIGALMGWALLSATTSPVVYGVLFGTVSGILLHVCLKKLLPLSLKVDPDDRLTTSYTIVGLGAIALILAALSHL